MDRLNVILEMSGVGQLTSYLCHQRPDRSFHEEGAIVFCARCSGIYVGCFCAAAWMLWTTGTVPMTINLRKACFLGLLTITTPIQALCEILGAHGNNVHRFYLGLASGIGILSLCHCTIVSTTVQHLQQADGRWRLVVSAALAMMVFLLVLPPLSLLGAGVSLRLLSVLSVLGFVIASISVITAILRTAHDVLSYTLSPSRRTK